MYVYDNICMDYFLNRKIYRQICRTNQTYILCSVTSSEIGTMITKCVQFCTDRQTIDSIVTGCVVIAYWIIKCTDTNWYDDNKMCTVLY